MESKLAQASLKLLHRVDPLEIKIRDNYTYYVSSNLNIDRIEGFPQLPPLPHQVVVADYEAKKQCCESAKCEKRLELLLAIFL